MKKHFIIFNSTLLILGNLLFSNIHILHDHDHIENSHECIECLIIENISNYIASHNSISTEQNFNNLLPKEFFENVNFNIQKIYLSRAPPISS
tara:strand:+ start:186 stop:464 length:279 start_codon:yes stop_codon:yes gene_type:complete